MEIRNQSQLFETIKQTKKGTLPPQQKKRTTTPLNILTDVNPKVLVYFLTSNTGLVCQIGSP